MEANVSFLVRLPIESYQGDAFNHFSLGGFSLGTARAAMWLSQLTYEDDDDKINSVLQKWQLMPALRFVRPLISLLPVPSTGGLIATWRDAIFIAFEGTDPLLAANWVTNFRFPTDEDGIHAGFRAALDSTWDDITATLDRLRPLSHVVLTGHSLGGALAVLCARRM